MPEYSVAQLLEHVNSSYSKPGNERVRQIAERLIADIYRVIVDFNVSHAELWSCFTWLNELGTAKQAGLVGAGLGLERLLDILADEADQHAKRAPGTPATQRRIGRQAGVSRRRICSPHVCTTS